MEKVTSLDGTPIAYHCRGAGPPLVLVHGTGAANAIAWSAVLPALEEHFSIYAVDRRGRGESGDSSTYAIEREFEDIATVVEATREPANLLGHSFGALCALEAALLTPNIRRLVLYEPVIRLTRTLQNREGFADRLQALLDAGDREGVLATHYREDVGMTPDEFEQFRASPMWPARLASAHALPRELRAEERYVWDAQRFKNLYTATLLLLGSDSARDFKETTEAIHKALPKSRIAVMPGQQHIAMYTAPDLFLREVLTFLTGPG